MGAIQIGVEKGNFRPKVNEELCNNDRGCHRCYDSCPGLGVSLLQHAKETFVDQDIKIDNLAGHYLKCFTGYSNNYDIRFHSASGGMVSQFLIWLLEKKKLMGLLLLHLIKTPLCWYGLLLQQHGMRFFLPKVPNMLLLR